IRNDRLRQIERQKCIECVKGHHLTWNLPNELEITKAITYLKEKDLAKAIETLKGFEKKDSKVQSCAATNLSFLYFLENEVSQADKYAELAITADRYNPA
ncbi:Intraflagellar transport protein 88, partial [Desmophyllum pertusum]